MFPEIPVEELLAELDGVLRWGGVGVVLVVLAEVLAWKCIPAVWVVLVVVLVVKLKVAQR